MKVIVDTSTLISLATICELQILLKMGRELVTPEVVYHEAVVKRERRGIADATIIKGYFSNHSIRIEKVDKVSWNNLCTKLSARFHKYGHVIGLLEILRHAEGMAQNDIPCHSERSEESQQYACQNTLP